MTVSLQGIPNSIAAIIQDRTLERMFHDALFPRTLFRGEAVPEMWAANLGERMVFTRSGLVQPKIAPLIPGADPTPTSYQTEQWDAEAAQYGDTIDTHMPSSYVSIASLFLRNTQQLGLSAAQTLDRLVRNQLFKAYLGGEAQVAVLGVIGSTQLQVTSLNGFTRQLNAGKLETVSAGNPLPVSFTGAGEPDNQIIGFAAANPANPFGPGTLTLASGLTTALAVRSGVLAATRSRRIRVGGHVTPDGLTSANILNVAAIITAVSNLRQQKVPPHADGFYHVHLEPAGEAEIFEDNHWQRMFQSIPDAVQYKDLVISTQFGCVFYRNTEMPGLDTVDTSQLVISPGGAGGARFSPEIGGELTNANGLPIRRAIVTGGGCIYEKYLDESKFITEAGVNGKIGQFSIINSGVAVVTQRIRYLLRAPQDRLQQIVSQSWSWSGDFPIPSDQLTGNGARFKRAQVIEFA